MSNKIVDASIKLFDEVEADELEDFPLGMVRLKYRLWCVTSHEQRNVNSSMDSLQRRKSVRCTKESLRVRAEDVRSCCDTRT